MTTYICNHCGKKQLAKRIKAMQKAGFGLMHLDCEECGNKTIKEVIKL